MDWWHLNAVLKLFRFSLLLINFSGSRKNWRSCWDCTSWARRTCGSCSRLAPSRVTDFTKDSKPSTRWFSNGGNWPSRARKRPDRVGPPARRPARPAKAAVAARPALPTDSPDPTRRSRTHRIGTASVVDVSPMTAANGRTPPFFPSRFSSDAFKQIYPISISKLIRTIITGSFDGKNVRISCRFE